MKGKGEEGEKGDITSSKGEATSRVKGVRVIEVDTPKGEGRL